MPLTLAQSNSSGRKLQEQSRETKIPPLILLLQMPSRTILPFPHTTHYLAAPSTTQMNGQDLRYQRNVRTEHPNCFWEGRSIMVLPSYWAKKWLATSTDDWEPEVWMLDCSNIALFRMKPHIRDTRTESFRQIHIQSVPDTEGAKI